MMAVRHAGWPLVLALALAMMPGNACADPDCDWRWNGSPNCDRKDYSLLHYWAPSLYVARGYIHRSYLDQYPPGPPAAIAPTYEISKHRCPSIPPAASSPYNDPTQYYGRPIAPP